MKIYWTGTGEVHALKGVDAEIRKGSITAVVGPSGSGKSSLLRLLACMDRPTAGTVTIGGVETSGLGARRLRMVRRRVGYVFQRPSDNLVPYLSAAEHMSLTARLKGTRLRDLSGLELLGLGARADHRPHQLSGGEQQRLAFAQALVGDPVLVVADEPTAELDSTSTSSLLRSMSEVADRGATIVVSTHDPAVVRTADRTYFLRHGALEAETSEARFLSVIDDSGRIQLPPKALELFPARRAVIDFDENGVRITPP